MLPQVWLTSREIALKSWLHWPKPAFFMTKEPRYQITKNLKGDFEILALSWPDEPGQEDWFTEEFSLVTLLEICQQWVNILENFSPYSSWSKRMVLLPLCFWGKNAAKTVTQSHIEKELAETANKILLPKFKTWNMIYIGPPNKIQLTKV